MNWPKGDSPVAASSTPRISRASSSAEVASLRPLWRPYGENEGSANPLLGGARLRKSVKTISSRQCIKRPPYAQSHLVQELRQSDARILRQSSCDFIPAGEGSPQQQVWFDGSLNLMEGKAEFTPPARWLSKPSACSPRGKRLGQYGSVFVRAARRAISRKAKRENFGRRAWANGQVEQGFSAV
jgi:hypothetical protein